MRARFELAEASAGTWPLNGGWRSLGWTDTHKSRELLKLVSSVTAEMRAEGELNLQMRSTAISMATNFAEGAERSERDFRRFLFVALGSNE